MRCTSMIVLAAGAGAWLSGAHALDGDADPGFGGSGQVVITRPMDGGGNGSKPTGDLAVLTDGRYLWAAPLDDGAVWIGRASRNGSPDTAFGDTGSGRVTVPACGLPRNVRVVADPDGSAVVWATACLVRLFADGSIDSAFGPGPLPPNGFLAAGLARDAEGRFVLAGNMAQQLIVYRFDASGAADATFGIAGSVTLDVPASNNLRDLDALAVRPDGRIVVAGSRGNMHGPNLIVVQLNADGSPDLSWNGSGLVDIAAPEGYQALSANALALDRDGSIVVSGMGSDGTVACCVLLARFDDAGQLVPSFGLRLFALAGQPNLFPFFEQRDGLVLLPNHRIMIGTISFPFTPPFTHRTQYTLLRAFANGRLDTTFGHDGWNSYTIADPDGGNQQGDYNQMHAIAYDRDDDSMLVLGRTFFEDNSSGDDYVSLVRARFDLIFADGLER